MHVPPRLKPHDIFVRDHSAKELRYPSTQFISHVRIPKALALILLLAASAYAGQVQKIGDDLYAYISDNDSSANATFLVGPDRILVVDTGLNPQEGEKLATAIRQVSPAPVKFIVNTHYHPDHQGGNRAVGSNAVIISTAFTREQTLALETKIPEPIRSGLRPADITSDRLMIYVGDYPVEVYFPGPAHTMGDLIVYFPKQQAVATGDLFMNRSCPAMDRGDARNWIQALDRVLDRPLRVAVPGHFEVGTRDDVATFRNYLADLYSQVETMKRQGGTREQVKSAVRMPKYERFRQFPKYEATFADNAAAIYDQLK